MVVMQKLRRTFLWLAAGALTACGGLGTDEGSDSSTRLLTLADIRLQQQIWISRRAGQSYLMEYQRECFCSPLPAKFRILTNGFNQKMWVQYLDNNGDVYEQHTSGPALNAALNIEDFFQRMQGPWLSSGPIQGRFDPFLGYPARVLSANFSQLGADDNGYEITFLQFQ
jgi:hypothetical protein